MYRFKSGKYKGKLLEEVMLRSAPGLYRRAEWASDKPDLRMIVDEFERLREKLRRARIYAKCRDCGKKAKWMTFEEDLRNRYLPRPSYWCNKCKPADDYGISGKIPIHFDAMKYFPEKWGKRQIHKDIREALGIKKGTRITETFAKNFFATLT